MAKAVDAELIDENGGGPGVRLRKRQQKKGLGARRNSGAGLQTLIWPVAVRPQIRKTWR
jgi:hypothetical protein